MIELVANLYSNFLCIYSIRLFVDQTNDTLVLKRQDNKPVKFFPFIQSAYANPFADVTNNKKVKLTASFHLRNENESKPTTVGYESLRSYELNHLDNAHTHHPRLQYDSLIGATSQLPTKVPPTTRQFLPILFNASSTTPRVIKSTNTTPKPSSSRNIKSAITRDNFRIIVEPLNLISKKSSTVATMTSPAPSTPFQQLTKISPSFENTIFTYKLPSADKFSATYRSLANVLSTTYTPYSIIQSQTTTSVPSTSTLTTTTVKPTNAAAASSVTGGVYADTNEKQRRFYIPRTDLLERKLPASPAPSATTTNSPTIPKTESVKITRPINVTPQTAILADSQNRHHHVVVSSTTAAATPNKLENEVLYYDEEYYDEGEAVASDNDQNDDNYIDNKITEYSTAKSQTSPKAKLIVKTPISSTAFPKSTYQTSPIESSSTVGRFEVETKRPHRFKESNSERCPQCNEKPLRYADLSVYYLEGKMIF